MIAATEPETRAEAHPASTDWFMVAMESETALCHIRTLAGMGYATLVDNSKSAKQADGSVIWTLSGSEGDQVAAILRAIDDVAELQRGNRS